MSVYFVTCRAANAVKIGHSVDPHARLPEIQLGCPLPLTLEAMLPGARDEEVAMHWRFSEHRLHGEWFEITDTMEAIIAANPPHRVEAKKGRKKGLSQERYDQLMYRSDPEAAARTIQRRVDAGEMHFPFRQEASA